MPTNDRLIKRLHIMQGQLGGLERMVKQDKYCVDIIRLSLAVQKSLQSFNQNMLEQHLHQHVGKQFRSGRQNKATKELLEIYFLNNK